VEKARAELKEAGSGDLVEVEDLGEILGKMSGILKIKSSKTASLTKLVSKKDKNNDGVVTVEDVFGVLEAEVEGERADDIKAFKRWWITYIPFWIMACICLPRARACRSGACLPQGRFRQCVARGYGPSPGVRDGLQVNFLGGLAMVVVPIHTRRSFSHWHELLTYSCIWPPP